MAIGGLHVDSHRIPGGVKYTGSMSLYSKPKLGCDTAVHTFSFNFIIIFFSFRYHLSQSVKLNINLILDIHVWPVVPRPLSFTLAHHHQPLLAMFPPCCLAFPFLLFKTTIRLFGNIYRHSYAAVCTFLFFSYILFFMISFVPVCQHH
jgi:hypothetical protein